MGVLEDLLFGRVHAAAWRLNQAVVAIHNGCELTSSYLEDLEWGLAQAVTTFERARSSRRNRWGQVAPSESFRAIMPPEPFENADDEVADLEDRRSWSRRFDTGGDNDLDLGVSAEDCPEPIEPCLLWRDRLVFDTEVSDTSPVVRGTWITVGQVVSLVVDGWSWADILRSHPELTEADIRACLAYSVEEDHPGSPNSR